MRPNLGPLIRAALPLAVRLGRPVLARRRSRTGRLNPRSRHIVGRLGYSLYTHDVSRPPMLRWLRGEQIFPAVVQVQTQNRCQAACEFCPYPETVGRQPLTVMDDATWTSVVRECASEPQLLSLVPMSKNEPLLDPALERRMAEFAAVRQPHQLLELVTNGQALTPARLRSLAAAGLDLISVSLNALDRETYQRVIKKLSWERVTANLDTIDAAAPRDVNVFIRYTQDLANQTSTARAEVGLRRRWPNLNRFGFSINDRAGTVRGFERLRARMGPLYRAARRSVVDHAYPGCPYLFSVAHVLANGDVPLCDNDWLDRHVLGNVNHTSLRAIFNSPEMDRLRQLHLERRFDEIDPCRECSIARDLFATPATTTAIWPRAHRQPRARQA